MVLQRATTLEVSQVTVIMHLSTRHPVHPDVQETSLIIRKKRICFWGLTWEESPVTVITRYCPIVLRKRTDTFSVKIMSVELPVDSEKEYPKRSSHPQMQVPA